MKQKIKILHLEDLHSDAELIEMTLKEKSIPFENLIVDTKEAFITGLRQFTPDVILADHSVSAFNSMEALKIVTDNKLKIPFILVSASISDEYSMKLMSAGASDYILKDRLDLLPQSIMNALFDRPFIKEVTVAPVVEEVFLIKPNNTSPNISVEDSLYDLSMLEEMDDIEYLVEIVSIFLQETPKELSEMRKAFINKKADVVGKQAHKLKSSSGLIQATVLSDILTEIEDIAKAGNLDDGLLKLIETATELYKKIETKLQKHIKMIPH